MKLLKHITSELDRAMVSNIRNNIEHKRDKFPEKNEIEIVCTVVGETLKMMEDAGICPLIYHYSGETSDHYNRKATFLKNYRGGEIIINERLEHMGCGLPGTSNPIIIVPSLHIGDSLEQLRFNYIETSDYVELWKDYPKRKTRITPEEQSEITGRE